MNPWEPVVWLIASVLILVAVTWTLVWFLPDWALWIWVSVAWTIPIGLFEARCRHFDRIGF
jgi:hypothetical protein